MKTLHLSIIAGIIIIATTSIGVFIEKIGENQQQPYAGITINGIKDNYTVDEPIIFSVTAEGYGTGCGDVNAIITKENDSQYQSPGWSSMSSCVSNAQFINFKFNALSENTSINQAGNYILTSSFDDSMTHRHAETEKKFLVMPYLLTGMATMTKENNSGVNAAHNTSIFDTNVYPFFVNVDRNNFTLNYNISGNNKLLDVKMDSQSKSLILSLESTYNGTLVVSIPRPLLDSKTNANQDDQFIVLEDGQEVDYKQINSTIMVRTLSIQFTNHTSNIEIIATQIV